MYFTECLNLYTFMSMQALCRAYAGILITSARPGKVRHSGNDAWRQDSAFDFQMSQSPKATAAYHDPRKVGDCGKKKSFLLILPDTRIEGCCHPSIDNSTSTLTRHEFLSLYHSRQRPWKK